MAHKSAITACFALGILLLAWTAQAQATLPQSAVDGMMRAIQRHWKLPPDLDQARDLQAAVRVNLDKQGFIVGKPEVQSTGGTKTQRDLFGRNITQAIVQSAPFTMLPREQYAAWRSVVIRFQAAAPMPG